MSKIAILYGEDCCVTVSSIFEVNLRCHVPNMTDRNDIINPCLIDRNELINRRHSLVMLFSPRPLEDVYGDIDAVLLHERPIRVRGDLFADSFSTPLMRDRYFDEVIPSAILEVGLPTEYTCTLLSLVVLLCCIGSINGIAEFTLRGSRKRDTTRHILGIDGIQIESGRWRMVLDSWI